MLWIAALLFLAAAVVALMARAASKKRRLILDTPTTPADDVEDGFLEVKGRVAAGEETLKSPLSGTKCVAYHFLVEQKSRGQHGASWIDIVKDRQGVPFFVVDESGRAEVDPRDAELELSEDHHARSGLLSGPPAKLTKVMKSRYGVSTKGLLLNKTLRYTETVLAEKDEVYVIGTASAGELRKGGPLFLISDLPEDALARNFGHNAIAGRIAAALLAAGGMTLTVLGLG